MLEGILFVVFAVIFLLGMAFDSKSMRIFGTFGLVGMLIVILLSMLADQ